MKQIDDVQITRLDRAETAWQPISGDGVTQRQITPVTPENAVLPGKPLRPLTRKQAAFVRHLIEHPKASATAAAKAAYGQHKPITDGTARMMGSENLAKPSIQMELAKYSGTAESTVLEVMEYSKEYGRKRSGAKGQGAAYANVALHAAKDILDRVHGKATQRTETTSTSVTLNIDLTGVAENKIEQ